MYHKSERFRRHQRARAIARKKRIARAIYHSDFYPNEGQYDKGKVHCSCPLCSYHRELDPKIKEMEKIVRKEVMEYLGGQGGLES